MLSRASTLFAKHRSKHPLDLPVHAASALCRTFGSLIHHQSKNRLDLPAQASHVIRRRSHISHQVHQLHHLPVRPHNSIWTSPACMLEPNDTVGGSFDQRLATLRSIGECANEDDLVLLLKKKTAPICYVWCDPSPWMHITQGISMTINVNKMVKAGFKVKILMADWFARTDPDIVIKTGGDLSQIQTIGCYNIEIWKAAGMYVDNVEFVRLSDEISYSTDEYWPLAMDIARKSDLSRIKSWLRVNASKDTRGHGSMDPYAIREFTAAEIFYPCLQSAAILFQKVDIWLLSLDLRAGYVLARHYSKLMEKENRPIALFHKMLPNLLEHPESESFDTRWAIFMEDDEEEVSRKMYKAFCRPKFTEGNPCLEYIKYIILPWFGKFEVVRKKKNGGTKTFLSMEELTADYESGTLDPADVKQALLKALNMILQPIHQHFRRSAEGKEIAKAMEKFYIIGR